MPSLSLSFARHRCRSSVGTSRRPSFCRRRAPTPRCSLRCHPRATPLSAATPVPLLSPPPPTSTSPSTPLPLLLAVRWWIQYAADGSRLAVGGYGQEDRSGERIRRRCANDSYGGGSNARACPRACHCLYSSP
ncbi:hypothetical protein PVAP13_6NG129000 [Panicum virgatum]|uniref:Uncharacterized protein n=1 Tax=Panicum virgatum TaxID=38727 RepID=A0A8T0QXT7_PANVG|nr:hypothetical protein PVAP13_6NG129000 [Panicum virgatum]